MSLYFSRRVYRCASALLLVALLLSLFPPSERVPVRGVAAAATDAVTLLQPETVRANGAELRWTRFAGTTFQKYYVHRSRMGGFAPSAATLVATIGDPNVVTYRDTSAGPGRTFYYKLVSNNTASNEVSVTTPAAGQAVKTLQPDAKTGEVTRIISHRLCYNYGSSPTVYVGTDASGIHRLLLRFDLAGIPSLAIINSAAMSLSYPATTNNPGTISVYRAGTTWREGTGNGTCSRNGATWEYAIDGPTPVKWTSTGRLGGNFGTMAWASVTKTAAERSTAGSDSYDLKGLVQSWVNGTYANQGALLKISTELDATGSPIPGQLLPIYSDDSASAGLRPKLSINYADTDPLSRVKPPTAPVSAPAANSILKGTVKVASAASDDHRVEKVEFFVDGVLKATDTAKPWEYLWDTTAATNAGHTLSVRSTDSGGNVTTSANTSVTVDNVAPATSLTNPTNQTPAAKVSGTVPVDATATDNLGVARVEFLFDGKRFFEDTSAPYGASWNTLDPELTAYDGSHQLTTKAYDTAGQVTTSAPVTVTVDNTTGTPYQAGWASTAIPQSMFYKPDVTTQQKYGVNVTITNKSGATWGGATTRLRYRWYDADGKHVANADGPAIALGADLAPGGSRQLQAVVEPPALPSGASSGRYTLRFDLEDGSGAAPVWYASKGNAPLEAPVLVYKGAKLGLEPYYEYDGEPVGAGMEHMVNVANGNSILRWTPFSAPGRGIDTIVDLTYNSLENGSSSPVGNNWSLGISSLARLGLPLDIHPNQSDQLAGNTEKWIGLTDADGTTHKFTIKAGSTTHYQEPAGVNLYLRAYSSTAHPADEWAVTTTDAVTFYYDADGYPTAVEDRNGNRLTYTLEPVPAGQTVGYARRVTRVTDAGGRHFDLSYYDNVDDDGDDDDGDGLIADLYTDEDDTPTAPGIGRLRYIRDHTGSELEFEYYDDGNLLRITQKGGAEAERSPMPDRAFAFTYANADGTGPAVPLAGDRVDPDPRTANQSTRLYSVRDPRGNETIFGYHGPATGANWWKLASRKDRAGNTTSYAYDNVNSVTTKAAPLSRTTKYGYDADGQVTKITNPKGEAFGQTWNADRQLTRVTEPSLKFTESAYDHNGRPTSSKDQLGNQTLHEYENVPVDAADTTGHISRLKKRTAPKGALTTTNPNDFVTSYAYDAKGNPTRVTDPEGHATEYAYNPDGTLASATDARGVATTANPDDYKTTFASYDAAGFPQTITDAKGQITREYHDADGLLRWTQDPLHQNDTGDDPREYRTYFDYDSFHRLGRTSTPKSTRYERGVLIWQGTDYDANDNPVARIHPHYGGTSDDSGGDDGTNTSSSVRKTRIAYDAMDRPTQVTGPDTSADPSGERTGYQYDAAGRLTRLTSPKGTQTTHSDKDFATFYAYDELDRVTKTTRYEVDSAGAITQTLNSHNCYQANTGDLLSVTRPKAKLASLTCDPTNGAAAGTSHTSRLTYDAAHRALSGADPLGNKGSVAYDPNGNIDGATDASGAKSSIGYDMRNLPTQVARPFDTAVGGRASITSRTEYDPTGNPSRTISPRGVDAGGTKFSTSYTHDALNRLTDVELPHDGSAKPREFVRHAYDANGNLAETAQPDTAAGIGSVSKGKKTELTHYDTGWIRTAREGSNQRVRYDYTPDGWQSLRVVEGNDNDDDDHEQDDVDSDDDDDGLPDYSATGASDQDDDGDGVPDADDDDDDDGVPDSDDYSNDDDHEREMRWSYYPDGMLQEREDEDGQGDSYEYDANNNLRRAVDGSGVTGAGSDDEAGVEIEASYDGFDRTKRVTQRKRGANVRHVTTYAYDENGNVTSRVDDAEEAYDSTANAWVAVAAKPGRKHTFELDGADRLESHTDHGTTHADGSDDVRSSYLYTQRGEEKSRSVQRWNGTAWSTKHGRTRSYFANGVLKNQATTDASGAVTESHDLSYVDGSGQYNNGHPVGDSYRMAGPDTAAPCRSNACTAKYTYDARGRLMGHDDGHGGVTGYELDSTGNLLKETKGTATRSFVYTDNRLTGTTAGARQEKQYYDVRGNLACVTLSTGTRADCYPREDGTRSPKLVAAYAYDYLDRLAGYDSYTTDGVTSTPKDSGDYTYDALDRLVEQSETHPGWVDARRSRFTYVGLTGQVAEETQHNDMGLLRTKSYGYDARGQRASLTYTPAGGSSTSYDLSRDPRGSVSMLLDSATGAGRASYGYTAHGEADPALTKGDPVGVNPLNPYRWGGARLDSGSTSYAMGARRYSSGSGRFLQRDSYLGAGSDLALSLSRLDSNRYAFAGGNPISYIDPTGHFGCGIFAKVCEGAKEVGQQVGGFVEGVVDTTVETVTGTVEAVTNPGQTVEGLVNTVQNPGQAWDAYTQPIREAWNNGEYGEAVGRVVGDAAPTLLTGGAVGGVKAAGTAGKLSRVVSTANKVDNVSPCSFAAGTMVATVAGAKAISELEPGYRVLAYDEGTGRTGYYEVTAVWSHEDGVIEYLVLDGETIQTTPEHPFYTEAGEWVPAGELEPGMRVRKADGSYGTVGAVRFVKRSQRMYNLTVDTAHTYFVGDGQWLLHNDCPTSRAARRQALRDVGIANNGPKGVRRLPLNPGSQSPAGRSEHAG